MSDWGTGATSEKRAPVERPKMRWYDVTCCRCGMNYMLDSPPYSIPSAMSVDSFVCKKCRSNEVRSKPAPPPEELQLAIEDVLGTKK